MSLALRIAFEISVLAVYLIVPLSDAMPIKCGRIISCAGPLAIVLSEGSTLALRKHFSVSERPIRVSIISARDDLGKRHEIVSSLNILDSFATMLIVLSLHVVFKSFQKPLHATLFRNTR